MSIYSVRLSVGDATKGFATYGCFHPSLIDNLMIFYLIFEILILLTIRHLLVISKFICNQDCQYLAFCIEVIMI